MVPWHNFILFLHTKEKRPRLQATTGGGRATKTTENPAEPGRLNNRRMKSGQLATSRPGIGSIARSQPRVRAPRIRTKARTRSETSSIVSDACGTVAKQWIVCRPAVGSSTACTRQEAPDAHGLRAEARDRQTGENTTFKPQKPRNGRRIRCEGSKFNELPACTI